MDVQQVHDEVDAGEKSSGGFVPPPKNQKILSDVKKYQMERYVSSIHPTGKTTFSTMDELKNRSYTVYDSSKGHTFNFAATLKNPIPSQQFKSTKGSQVSYADAYKKTGIWEGEGSLPTHLEGTYKKPNLLKRIFHKSNFKWRSGGTT